MTSDAPERIHLLEDELAEFKGTHPVDGSVSYTRTDTAKAQVVAAYEDAADTCFNPKWPLKTSTDHVQARTAAIIRARIPDDHKAALDRMLQAEREKALREAAEICKRIRVQKANGPMPERACFDYEQAILALIDGDEETTNG